MAILDAISAASEQLAYQWPYVLTAALTCAVAWLLQAVLRPDPLAKLPLYGSDLGNSDKRREVYMKNARQILGDGARMFKNQAYRVTTTRTAPTVIVDAKFLKELKDLPDDTLNLFEAIDETLHTKWTKVASDSNDLGIHTIKTSLTPALHRLNPVIAEEVDRGFRDEFPDCSDWTKIPLNKQMLRIIAKVSGRIFVGPELCLSEEYIDMGINFTIDVVTASREISRLKPSERDAKAPRLPAVKKLQARRERALNFLRPVIQARKKAMIEDPGSQKPDDMLQWMLDARGDFGDKQDDENLTQLQLGLTFAAIHTTSMTSTSVFYSLAAHPQYVPELRDEIRSVLEEYGTFTTAALQKMKKLDSFIREVMRFYPLGFVSFMRKTLKPFTLSNGQEIPAGVVIQVASEPAHAANVDDPDVFDPWRFQRLRDQDGLSGIQRASAGAANQMVTVSPGNLTFGYGRHACPGRFFAVNEIKMILGRAILEYDIKRVDGSLERFPNIALGDTSSPDPTKELLFKKVQL